MNNAHLAGAPSAAAIHHLAILGAGAEGTALAERAAQAGYRVTLEDLMPGKRREAARQLGGSATAITYAATVEEAVRGADLVIDFVPDELESKLEIFSLLDRMAPPHTIFATPTRTLSIADLASCTYRADRCFALRFDQNLGQSSGSQLSVELIQSPLSAQAAVVLLADFWRCVGAQVLITTDHNPLP